MRDAYAQALRVYFVRPMRSMHLGIFAACGLLALVLAMFMRHARGDYAVQMIGSALFLGMTVWLIFREQVVDPRRRLLPNFVGPQVTAFGVVSAGLVTLLIVAVGGGDVSTTHAAALVALFFAGVGLVILTQSKLLCGVFLLISYGPSIGLPTVAWARITPGTAPAVLAGSAIAVALIVVGFFRIAEESPWYGSPGGDSLNPRATGDGDRPWAAAGEGRWRRLLTPRRTWPVARTAWQRTQRWRCQSRLGFLLMAAWFGAVSMFMRWPMLTQAAHTPSPRPPPDMSPLFLGALVSQAWLLRWRYLGTELLRPVARPAFFRQLGGAMAIDFAVTLAACVAVMAVPQFVTTPAREAVRVVAPQAACYAGFFVLFFGLTALLLRHRSRGLLMLNVLALLPAGLIPIVLDDPLEHAGPLTAGIAAVSLVGVALAVRAYRKWLDVELA